MSHYRSEVTIPIELGHKKSHEAYLHRNSSPRSGIRSPTSPFQYSPRSDYPTSMRSTGPWHRAFSNDTLSPNEFTEGGDQWFGEMRRRFDDRRRQWDEDVRRMRQDFFTLRSIDDPDRFKRTLSPPRLLLPRSRSNSICPFWSSTETGPDGTTHFTANFDVSGFRPEGTRVSVRGDEVFVIAKNEDNSDRGSHSREYTRSVFLPDGADDSLATATLNTDGVLTFSCPIIPKNRSIKRRQMQSESSDYPIESPTLSQSDQVQPFRTIRTDPLKSSSTSEFGRGSKPRFRLEFPVGTEYSPAEIQIRTLDHRIYVTAKHEEHCSNRKVTRGFSKEYDIPDHVNPESLEAKMDNGVLVIEAITL